MDRKESEGKCDWLNLLVATAVITTVLIMVGLLVERYQVRTTVVHPVDTPLVVTLSGVCTGERTIYQRAVPDKPIAWVMPRGSLACTVQNTMANITQGMGLMLPFGQGPRKNGEWAVATVPPADPPLIRWFTSDNGFAISWPANTLALGTVVDLLGPIEITQ